MEGCRSCDVITGRAQAPGAPIFETSHWWVEHALGRLGVGTLFVKPKRHVLHLVDLNDEETAEVGQLLRLSADVVSRLVPNEQVYACMWSHTGEAPVHVHFIVQPLTAELLSTYGTTGPRLQAAMLDRGHRAADPDIEAFAQLARQEFAARLGS